MLHQQSSAEDNYYLPWQNVPCSKGNLSAKAYIEVMVTFNITSNPLINTGYPLYQIILY